MLLACRASEPVPCGSGEDCFSKTSLFYKTRNGARVGDIYMSLIHTCELNDINAFDYLNQLQLNALDVVEHPVCWMPWNYQDNAADGDERTDGSAPEAGTTHVAACST